MNKRMNRIFSFVLLVTVVLLTVGCSSGSTNNVQSKAVGNSTGIVDVEELARRKAEAENKAAALAAKAKGNQVSSANKNPQSNVAQTKAAPKVDIDLTVLSPTMLLAEVQNIAEKSYEYEGKIMKINGRFNSFIYEGNNKRYYQCVLSDACCTFESGIGLEFEWAGNHKYPDDYPEIQDPITVTGRFKIYEEDGKPYATLASSDVTF